MDKRILIIIAAFVMLMVAFGRNPVEEAKQRALAKTQGKDALILAIEEHNAEKSAGFNGLGSMGTFGDMALPAGGNGSNGAMGMGNNGTFGTGGNYLRPPNYPGYMHKGGQNPQAAPRVMTNPAYAPETVVGTDGQPIFDQQGEVLDPAKQGYYPPPPLPGTNPQPHLRRPQPRSEMKIQLPNGQPVGFRDTAVFTVDATGQTVPMPDGVYPMYDGQINLVVSGGQSIIINN